MHFEKILSTLFTFKLFSIQLTCNGWSSQYSENKTSLIPDLSTGNLPEEESYLCVCQLPYRIFIIPF